MDTIETDYLVVGAGAAGMAFVDTLISECDAEVVMVDRRHAPGGHWHHGELQIDRMYSLRPVFGAANYRGPLVGLYICGAGTHPGGGMCGASGLNAARQVIADTKEA